MIGEAVQAIVRLLEVGLYDGRLSGWELGGLVVGVGVLASLQLESLQVRLGLDC